MVIELPILKQLNLWSKLIHVSSECIGKYIGYLQIIYIE